MGSSPPSLPALATSPKIIFFTDYDGTITQQDSNDYMTDNIGFGSALRLAGNASVLAGERHFHDAFQEMMDSIRLPYSQCISLLKKNIALDPKFKEFFLWCRANNVPIVILSGGMRPIIRAMLEAWLGADAVDSLQIVSNDVAVRDGKASLDDEGGWRIVFHDESVFGHDKSREIRPYAALPAAERPILLYAGDGVSDLSAAKETDLLFAKKDRDLVTWCEREGVKFTTFEDFGEILETVKGIASGEIKVEDAATGRK